ncbi:MAG: hypothetical protein IT428_19785 [Planctomycetaceae bacterium]|nr:hypothetical protein [Planctomycetaceae bacterium]
MDPQRFDDLFVVKSGEYRPQPRDRARWSEMRLPLFTIRSAERMLFDEQVTLGLGMKIAPLLKPKFEIVGRPDLVKFAGETLRKLWTHAVPQILDAKVYSRAGGEMIYRLDPDDRYVKFHKYRQFDPNDFTILTKRGEKWGLRLRSAIGGTGSDEQPVEDHRRPAESPLDLVGLKSFVYVHRRKNGSWDGRSDLEGCYDAWVEKTARGGAKDIRKLWFYKNAFGGGILFHPPGNYTDPRDPTKSIPWSDIARQAAEMAQTGAVMTFPFSFDSQGNVQKDWEYVPPQINGSASEILNYGDRLDTAIMRGLGIPDDVSTAVGTGSFAGRTIPLMTFFLSQNVDLRSLVTEIKEQVLDPLVWINFESREYEIVNAEVNLDELMPATPSQAGKGPEKIPADSPQDGTPENPPASEGEPTAQMSEGFDESKHPRGQQGNKGQFASSPSGGPAATAERDQVYANARKKRDRFLDRLPLKARVQETHRAFLKAVTDRAEGQTLFDAEDDYLKSTLLTAMDECRPYIAGRIIKAIMAGIPDDVGEEYRDPDEIFDNVVSAVDEDPMEFDEQLALAWHPDDFVSEDEDGKASVDEKAMTDSREKAIAAAVEREKGRDKLTPAERAIVKHELKLIRQSHAADRRT